MSCGVTSCSETVVMLFKDVRDLRDAGGAQPRVGRSSSAGSGLGWGALGMLLLCGVRSRR